MLEAAGLGAKLEMMESTWRMARVRQAGVLVDGRDYFRTFFASALRAERYILMCGWQFDSNVRLVRPPDDVPGSAPSELLPFLEHLCRSRPELRIYVLAWDFSLVFALEREWLQELKFGRCGEPRLRFEFDRHPTSIASHHQKFVVLDGVLGFAGGLDICEGRWDDRAHLYDQSERVNADGTHYKPYHDAQAAVVGDAAAELVELFQQRWHAALGEHLELPPARRDATFDLRELSGGSVIEISSDRVGLSRTRVDARAGQHRREIAALFAEAIAGADHLIYTETQYFTSRWLAEQLTLRMRRRDLPRLVVVVVMPRDADTPKEKWAIGRAQSELVWNLQRIAKSEGHRWFSVYPETSEDGGAPRPVFIHSKILIVDDVFLSVGSANLTNRSMGLDSELNLTWSSSEASSALANSIRRLRSDLLAEHCGVADAEVFERAPDLGDLLDRELRRPGSRLRWRMAHPQEGAAWPSQLFDPENPVQPLDALTNEALTELERQFLAPRR